MKKLCVITGGASGLGLEAVKQLLTTGEYRIMMACRDRQRGAAVAGELAKAYNSDVELEECDLASLASVHKFADKVVSMHSAVDLLVCNAGAMKFSPTKTVDGFESLLQVNHLSHFLLCHKLLPALQQSTSPKVVMVSSELHKKVAGPLSSMALFHEGLLSGEQKYDGFNVYSHTKLYNTLFAYQFSRKFAPQVPCVAVTPGFVPATSLNREISWPLRTLANILLPWTPIAVTVPEGGRRIVAACLDKDPQGLPTVYYSKGVEGKSSELSYDTSAAEMIWKESCDLLGITDF